MLFKGKYVAWCHDPWIDGRKYLITGAVAFGVANKAAEQWAKDNSSPPRKCEAVPVGRDEADALMSTCYHFLPHENPYYYDHTRP